MATFFCLEGGHCREVQLYFSAYPINFSFCKVLKYQQAIALLPTFKLFWNGQVPYQFWICQVNYMPCAVYTSHSISFSYTILIEALLWFFNKKCSLQEINKFFVSHIFLLVLFFSR